MTQLKDDWPFPNEREARPAVLPRLRVKPWASFGATPAVVLLNCLVVDPSSGSLLSSPHDITITNGLFSSLTPSSESSPSSYPAEATTVDCSGKYVCPGLIDAHVHVTAIPGTETMADMARTADELKTLRTTFVLRSMLERGFTTVRDTGGASGFLASSIAEGLLVGPRLFQCGKAISQTGGHGDFIPVGAEGHGIGCCGGHAKSLGRTADGVPAVLTAVREELKQGADFIKIMVGGGVASETDAIETVQYTVEEIRAITDAAWRMGKRMCTAHAYTDEAIAHAVENGVRGIEHGNLMTEKTAKMMAEKGIWLTPTLSCYGIMVRKPFENFLPLSGQAKNREVMAEGLAALKMAEEAGVQICYGSDLLISMHALQTEEFTVRSRVLTPAQILKHATINPAKMLGKEGKLGIIAPGAIADLVVLDKNPLEDIKILDRPEENLLAVVKDGRIMSGAIGKWRPSQLDIRVI